MKISYKWLKQYVPINLPPVMLEQILTGLGLEVDAVEDYQSVKGGLEGLVIGHVIERSKHPNADSLSLTKVDIGTGQLLSIVCGAPNVEAGQKVVVAPIDTVLYHGEETFKIKKAKIRGELSEGMICAEDEIGLGTSHSGIMVLDADAKVGMLAKEYFNVENDTIFEISITPNRIENSSHLGIARDVVAFLKLHTSVDELAKSSIHANLPVNIVLNTPSVDSFKTSNESLPISVIVENHEACPRYCGITISGLQVKDSPEWLQNALKAIGQKPINNVVDITNFVLHETGQPLHAFDANKIIGNKVIVKTLSENQIFVTLDGVERKLASDDLMICNENEGMCIAGVFGGMKSGISGETQNIFLESAYFNPSFVRKTSKRHAIQTDSSFRFERGVDPNNTVYALKRAALLIQEIAGGVISSNLVDVYPKPIEHFHIELSYQNIDRLIGKVIARNTIKEILKAIDISIEKETENGLIVNVPPRKVDVQGEADVIEDILRFYGYNNVEIKPEVHSTLSYAPKPNSFKLINIVSDFLASCGFNEAMSNSLTKSTYYDKLSSYKAENLARIANPLSSDLNAMRQTLLFGGLEAIIRNMNYKNSDLKFFEFGNCYFFDSSVESDNLLNYYFEEMHLALFVSGKNQLANWKTKPNQTDFYFLKSYAENIFTRLGLTLGLFNIEEVENDIFEIGIAYQLNKKNLLTIGKVNKTRAKEFDIDKEVFYADFNWSELLHIYKGEIVFKEIAKYPEVKRDLALLLDKNIKFEQIKTIAFKTEKKFLKKVDLFDVFEDEKLGADKKSYAISFLLQDESKTLTDNLIDKIMQSFILEFEKQLGAKVR